MKKNSKKSQSQTNMFIGICIALFGTTASILLGFGIAFDKTIASFIGELIFAVVGIILVILGRILK